MTLSLVEFSILEVEIKAKTRSSPKIDCGSKIGAWKEIDFGLGSGDWEDASCWKGKMVS